MLVKLAAFFDTSTDHLLGVDRAAQEEAIQEAIAASSRLWAAGNLPAACASLKAAMHAYPGDDRLIARYLNALTAEAIRAHDPIRVRSEAETLYASIRAHCTVDKIRIWAQQIMVNCYARLAETPDSGVGETEIEAILDNMPLMQNGRDYAATYHRRGEARRTACAQATVELNYLLCGVCMNYAESGIEPPLQAAALEAALAAVDAFFPNGDYGKLYPGVIRVCKFLARAYAAMGDDTCMQAAAARARAIAAAFDAVAEDACLTHSSPLVAGITVEKCAVPFHTGGSQTEGVEEFLRGLGTD